jgi:predicted RNA-binding protein Jag
MDWIVTTGTTVEAALDVALDELSVTQDDVEFEIIKEPKNSVFGFRRNQARVRVRVRPIEPPAKREWRRPTKSDKGRKARKSNNRAKTGPTRTGNNKRPQKSGSSENKVKAGGQNKAHKGSTGQGASNNGQTTEAPKTRKRTIGTEKDKTNIRSINDQKTPPGADASKVRRTRKIDH